jgi:mono/diheme cytochrome c family protein
MIYRLARIALGAAAAVLFGAASASANEEAAKVLTEIGEKYQMDMKKLFATNCSWCHDGFGMDGGKGPKLAGTSKSQQQVFNQIANGKSGYMPGFKKTLKEEQIQALAEYIKALPAN